MVKAYQTSLGVTIGSLDDLVAVAVQLGARDVAGWTVEEEHVARRSRAVATTALVNAVRAAIIRGDDPLGDEYCRLLSPDDRRPQGQTYTPAVIVNAMTAWAKTRPAPARVIDPGAGSARFLVAAGHAFPQSELIAVEIDPLTAILARAHLAAAGLADRSTVIVGDYRALELPTIAGPTLFLGNPPYVRHHLISPEWKRWLVETARRHGYRASQLAGLHVHFFLATAEHAQPGDVGVLITAAEWLDVNYGQLVRDLMLNELGLATIQIIEPSAMPFPDAATTAVITGFEVGSRPARVGMRRVAALDQLADLPAAREIARDQVAAAARWTPLTRAGARKPASYIELGELCRVHRGQVTGANRIWVANGNAHQLPETVLFPSVTRAKELFEAGGCLTDTIHLKRVIDLPVDLDCFTPGERERIGRFLKLAQEQGADQGFIARNRRAWWSVGLRDPAPILASYMARRPPVFVRNLAGARHINIAHGLYPREPLSEAQLRGLATYLSAGVSLYDGRTYAGGLTKFEPREMERLLVPRPELLADPALLDTTS